MQRLDLILREAAELADAQRAEVLDFIGYLKTRHPVERTPDAEQARLRDRSDSSRAVAADGNRTAAPGRAINHLARVRHRATIRLLVLRQPDPGSGPRSRLYQSLFKGSAARTGARLWTHDHQPLVCFIPRSEAKSLKPWREIARPHQDVLHGTFKQSEFAADISQVANSTPHRPSTKTPRHSSPAPSSPRACACR